MRILITAGGTEEPIDGVRTISNFSTGRTGAAIADHMVQSGFKVTLLTSLRGHSPKEHMNIIRYQSFSDLNTSLKKLLSTESYSGVIHLAAVSDYSVDYLQSNGKKLYPNRELKLDSSKSLSIHLKPNFKIIDRIKTYSKNPLTVVGFKLTKNASDDLIKDKVNKVLSSGEVDYVVHNDLTSIDRNSHKSSFYKGEEMIGQYKNKEEMALALANIFKEI